MLAIALHLAFRRRRRWFVDNAAFSAHLVSFVLISSLTLTPVMRVMNVNETIGLVWILTVLLWQFLYLGAAVRRYYFDADAPGSWPRLRAYAAAVLIYVVNSAFVTVVQMIGGTIAFRGI
jgi:hypothetical protein